MSDDILEDELKKLEKKSDESTNAESDTKSKVDGEKKKTPKKNFLTAILLAIGFTVYFLLSLDDSDSNSNSNRTEEPEAPITVSEVEPAADAKDDFTTVEEIDDALGDLLEDFPDSDVVESTVDEATKTTAKDEKANGWMPVDEEGVSNWSSPDGISKVELDAALSRFASLERYEADIAGLRDQVKSQAALIQELKSSQIALTEQIGHYEKLMDSVELDVMLNKERPVLSEIAILQPRFDCESCSSKASFLWEGIDTQVSDNTVFMGFKVNILGDTLKLTSGTVEHVYYPEI